MAPFRPSQKTTTQEYIAFLLQLVIRMRKMKWNFSQIPNPSQFDWVNLGEEFYLIKRHCGNDFLISSSYELIDLGKEKYKYGGKKGYVLWKEWIDKIPEQNVKVLYQSTLDSFSETFPLEHYFYRLFSSKEYTDSEMSFRDDFEKFLRYEPKKE